MLEFLQGPSDSFPIYHPPIRAMFPSRTQHVRQDPAARKLLQVDRNTLKTMDPGLRELAVAVPPGGFVTRAYSEQTRLVDRQRAGPRRVASLQRIRQRSPRSLSRRSPPTPCWINPAFRTRGESMRGRHSGSHRRSPAATIARHQTTQDQQQRIVARRSSYSPSVFPRLWQSATTRLPLAEKQNGSLRLPLSTVQPRPMVPEALIHWCSSTPKRRPVDR